MQPNIHETGLKTLIGADQQVDGGDYGASVQLFDKPGISGEIVSIGLVSRETGSGSVQTPDATLLFFDADPAISAGDTALATNGAEHQTLVGQIDVLSGLWVTDANGGFLYLTPVSVPFHQSQASLYVAILLDSAATSFNDVAGDDEILEANFWYWQDA